MPNWSEGAPVPVVDTLRHSLEYDGRAWEISVYAPHAAGPLPTLYVTDPGGTFLATVSVASTLRKITHGLLPPIAIVGIGPPGEPLDDQQRFRDFTPTDHVPPLHPSAEGVTGGAEKFLSLLADVVIPFVEAGFPLDPADRGIAGWSLGGLLTAHALLTRADVFSRFVAVSPSLWFDDRILPRRAATLPVGALNDVEVFIAVGEHESDWSGGWPTMPAESLVMDLPDMVADAGAFCGELSRILEKPVKLHVLQGESHGTIWWNAIARALIALYATDPYAST